MFLYEEEIRDMVKRGKLEVHLALSRDRKGIVYDRATRTLVEKEIRPRYVDSVILEEGDEITELIAPGEVGGLGGYIYICGSAAFYETVSRALRKLPRYHNGEILFEKAFSQGRVMLDIFTPPRQLSASLPKISITDLARQTGNRGGPMWIAVHGNVYDITDFIPIHPGGALILSTSAGQDCSTVFDRVGHSSNSEVLSLLSNYLIGTLASVPKFSSKEVTGLCETWRDYLKTCVESITTISLELEALQDREQWLNNGGLDMSMVRRLYQFQSRFIENVLESLFGAAYCLVPPHLTFSLRDIHLKVSTMLLTSKAPLPPDIVGLITLAHTSRAATKSRNTIAQLGDRLSRGTVKVQNFTEGLIAYSKAVTELDVKFLERIREEICIGLDALTTLQLQNLKSRSEKQVFFLLSAFDIRPCFAFRHRLFRVFTGLHTDYVLSTVTAQFIRFAYLQRESQQEKRDGVC
jgi:cytochrome b involved in lipid metabolism